MWSIVRTSSGRSVNDHLIETTFKVPVCTAKKQAFSPAAASIASQIDVSLQLEPEVLGPWGHFVPLLTSQQQLTKIKSFPLLFYIPT